MSRVPRARHASPRRLRAIRIAAVAALVVATLAPAGSALAAPSLVLSPSSGTVGTAVTATASGFSPSAPIKFLWDNAVLLGTVNAGSTGSAKLSFDVPAARAGAHFVRACQASITCPPDPNYADASFSVVAPTPKPTATPRPTRPPTPRPTIVPPPTSEPPPTPAPSTGASPDTSPAPTAGPTGVPIASGFAPTFPIVSVTPEPTDLPLLVVTPAPTPPTNLAASPGPFPDLEIRALEVTQGIQNMSNQMPLVEDRRTYVRVHLDVDGAFEMAHVYGALEGRRNGQQLGWIWPENGPITARAGGGNRLDLDDSLYYRLPFSWMHGSVELRAFVYSIEPVFAWSKEPEWQDNFFEFTATFHPAETAELHLVPAHMHRSFHQTDVDRTYDPSIDEFGFAFEAGMDTSLVLAGMWRYHPIADLLVDVVDFPVEPMDHADVDEWDLGDCHVTIVALDPVTTISDWRPLMSDPEVELPIDVWTEPDRSTTYVFDRTYEIDHFYPKEDGTATVFGSSSGPLPLPVAGAPLFIDGCPNPDDEGGEIIDTLAAWRAWYDWADAREFFVAMVDPSLWTRWGGQGSYDQDTAWVKMRQTFDEETPSYVGGAATFAHEVAHMTGLLHTPCADFDDDGIPDELKGGAIDPFHPQNLRFPECSLAETIEHGWMGFDTYWDMFGLPGPTVISNDSDAADEHFGQPLLGYWGPRWIDPYNYCLLLNYYGVDCDADSIDLPWNPPAEPGGADYAIPDSPHDALPADPGVPLVLLSGSVGEDGSEPRLEVVETILAPSLDLLRRLEDQADRPDFPGAFRVQALDAGGFAQFELLALDGKTVHAASSRIDFSGVVPLTGDVAAIVLVNASGARLAEVPVSSGGPRSDGDPALDPDVEAGRALTADTVLEFDASDPDGDPVRATVLYSPDGEAWQVVARDLPVGRHRLGDGTAGLPGSTEGRLRIVLSDGVNAVVAGDDLRVVVADGPPTPWITGPFPGTTYPLGGSILLAGTASDSEDRVLPDDRLRWTSSIDGDLGTGREVVTRNLTAGRHELTLTATDSAGNSASVAVEIMVDGAVVAGRPSVELEATVGGIFDRLGSGQDPAPVGDDHPDFLWSPIVVAGAAIIAVAALIVVAFGAGRSFRSGRSAAPATVGGTQQVSVGRAQDGGSPELLGHEAAHTIQGESPPSDDSGPPASTHKGAGMNEIAMDDTTGKDG